MRLDVETRLVLMRFFLNESATTDIYTLSLHDALPIYHRDQQPRACLDLVARDRHPDRPHGFGGRSEEHTSELQSRGHLVCRLLLQNKIAVFYITLIVVKRHIILLLL